MITVVDEQIDRLNKFSELEGSEAGEYWRSLTEMWVMHRASLSEKFTEALVTEIMIELRHCELNMEIVEVETEVAAHTVKETVLREKHGCL